MSHELYFIPIIARAIEQRDVSRALRDTFAEIERLGHQPDHAWGYSNFQRFMAEAARSPAACQLEALQADGLRALIAELGTDTFEGDEAERQCALKLLGERPKWQAEYERFCTEHGTRCDESSEPQIVLMRGTEIVGRMELDRAGARRSVSDVSPGVYSLASDSGRLIWESRLTDRDLIWSSAYPGRSLDLAADTGESVANTSREETLLDGELILRVIPGLEAGRIELERRR